MLPVNLHCLLYPIMPHIVWFKLHIAHLTRLTSTFLSSGTLNMLFLSNWNHLSISTSLDNPTACHDVLISRWPASMLHSYLLLTPATLASLVFIHITNLYSNLTLLLDSEVYCQTDGRMWWLILVHNLGIFRATSRKVIKLVLKL